MAVRPRNKLFTVRDFEHMDASGVFGPEERVELVNGAVIEMSPIGSPHAAHVDRLTRLFGNFASRAIVRVQGPIRASDLSQPQPDLALLRLVEDFYLGGHPGPTDVYLVVEVADSSLGFDREVKAGLYAAAGIPDYWIVDIEGAQVDCYRVPAPEGYRQVETYRHGETLAPLAFPDVQLAIESILGPR